MVAGLLVKVNNFGFSLTFTVQNADGSAFDLTSLYVTLYVYTQEQDPTLLFYGNCTISGSPTLGVCTYAVVQGNFPTTGTYNAELEMTDTEAPTPPSNIEVDTQTFTINVINQHPAIPS